MCCDACFDLRRLDVLIVFNFFTKKAVQVLSFSSYDRH